METKRPLTLTVTPCRCGRQPQHVRVHAGDRHYLECAPCERRTARFGALDLAIDSWEQDARPPAAVETAPAEVRT